MKYVKKVYLNTEKTKYCIVELYTTRKEMRVAYNKHPSNNAKGSKILGAHCGYEKYRSTQPRWGVLPETGTVFLSLENCGAGVVAHEIMHAVLWAWKHKRLKNQYPIVIKNMNEEEKILHNHSYAVMQFYRWYWKVIN